MGKLIIFDCDGVLVDTEPLANAILADFLTEAGWPMRAEEAVRRFKGGRLVEIQAEAERRLGRSLGDDWIDRLYAYEFKIFEREVQAIPGVAGVLDLLDQRAVPYAVASNGPTRKMRVTLGTTGLWDRNEGRIFSAEMVTRPKPAPDLFLLAAQSLDVSPGDCVVVEDSSPGVRGGKAAGMTVYGFAADNDPDELRAAGADRVFFEMAELPEMLGIA